jgi:hypothetical protein
LSAFICSETSAINLGEPIGVGGHDFPPPSPGSSQPSNIFSL